jgi:hypothetical protein
MTRGNLRADMTLRQQCARGKAIPVVLHRRIWRVDTPNGRSFLNGLTVDAAGNL